MKRHLILVHTAFAKELDLCEESGTSTMPKILVEMGRNFFETACVKMVTAGGLTFNVFEKPGIEHIFRQVENGLKLEHINRNNIIMKLDCVEEQFRHKMSDEFVGRFLSLKADSATHRSRSVLGLNCQYLDGKSMIVRTLGMIEVNEAQTAETIKEEILKNLHKFGISIDRIYSITTDNGANFVKAAELLRKAQEDSNDDVENLSYHDDMEESDDYHEPNNVDNNESSVGNACTDN